MFDSTGLLYYESCVKEALSEGALQVTSRGTNALFCPSTQSRIGEEYRWGQLTQESDAVLVVKTSDPDRIHGRPEVSSRYSTEVCDHCGDRLF